MYAVGNAVFKAQLERIAALGDDAQAYYDECVALNSE